MKKHAHHALKIVQKIALVEMDIAMKQQKLALLAQEIAELQVVQK
jgi:hypothetical protein